MTRDELIKRVALKMDEISSSDDVIVNVGIEDNNPLYTQINSLLNECVNDVLTKAPIYRIQRFVETLQISKDGPSPDYKKVDIFGGSRYKLVVEVPDDFIRIASIVDSLFQRPIVDLALEGDSVDKMQHIKHLVAKYAKPVAVLGRNDDGGRAITCYSYKIGDTYNTNIHYVKRYDGSLELSEDTGLDEYMIDLVSWVCAGRVFASRGDINNNKICDENAAALMV